MQVTSFSYFLKHFWIWYFDKSWRPYERGLHELVYNELISAGATTAQAARYWTGLLVGNDLKRFPSLVEYLGALKSTGFKTYAGRPLSTLTNVTPVAAGKFYDLQCQGGWQERVSESALKAGEFCLKNSRPVKAIAASQSHTCAIINNEVQCWGSNEYGKLNVPKLTNPRLLAVTDVNSCAVADEGIKCWGTDYDGVNTPPDLQNVLGLEGGDGTYCAYNKQEVKCWGFNPRGTFNPPPLDRPTSVALTQTAGCGIFAGNVRCWGSSDWLDESRNPPIDLVKPTVVVGRFAQFCALDEGTARCWPKDRGYIPSGTKGVEQIVMGNDHSCALTDGSVKCWGSGDGESVVNGIPPLKSPYLLASGKYHVCAADADGIQCWGSNEEGQATPPK